MRAKAARGRGAGAAIATLLFGVVLALVAAIAAAAPAAAERRVALVIGNSGYRSVVALSNPRNDAEDVATVLRDLDFEVMIRTDVQKNDIRTVLKDFSRMLGGADTALVYYAGHALQYGGRYFLMPIDAALEDEDALRFDMLPADEIRELLAKVSGVRIMVFDACRNDPFSDKPPPGGVVPGSATRGLTRAKRAQGSVIAFATAPFDVAEDGNARNSPFTRAFLARLKEPGLEIGQLFRLVTRDVSELTGGRQTPEITISMLDDYRLNRSESDRMFWARIRWSEEAADFHDFVSRFPASPFVEEARFRLAALEAAGRAIDEARARAGKSGPSEREKAEQMRICVDEAARVAELAVVEDRTGLEALKTRAQCPETAGRVDRFLTEFDRNRATVEAAAAAAAERERAEREAAAAASAANAAAEKEKARLAAEAAAKSQAEQCRAEAATIDAAATAGRRADLAALIGKTCGENKGRLDKALEGLAAREAEAARTREAQCRREIETIDQAVAGGRRADLAALLDKICPENKGRLDAALDLMSRREAERQKAEAERQKAEAACTEETRELERLKGLGGSARADLDRLAASARCDRVKPMVTAALAALPPPPPPPPPGRCSGETIEDAGFCIPFPALEEPPVGTKIRIRPDARVGERGTTPPDDTEGPASAPQRIAPVAPSAGAGDGGATPTKPVKPIQLGL